MNSYNRNGRKWSVSEILSLQREYELLEMNVQDIAIKHERTVSAILHKLVFEEFIERCNDARGYIEYCLTQISTINEPVEIELDLFETNYFNDESIQFDILTDRIWNLETSVSEINIIVKKMFDVLIEKKEKKNPKRVLRSIR